MKLVTIEKTVYKAIVAVIGFAGIVVSQNLLHGTALEYTNEGIAFASAVLVWMVPGVTKTSISEEPTPVVPVAVAPVAAPVVPEPVDIIPLNTSVAPFVPPTLP